MDRLNRHCVWGLCLGVTLLMTLGCGGATDQPDLGDVSGTVTLDGKPLPDATITFQPADGRPSFGKTDSSGKYTLQYTVNASGAKIGKHSVIITTAYSIEGDDGESKEIPEKLPAKYSTSETELTADVKAGPNTFDYNLSSK